MAGLTYTDEEKEILKKLWINPKVSKDDIEKVFPNRTWDGLLKISKKLHLKSFSVYRQAEIDYEYLKNLLEVVEE